MNKPGREALRQLVESDNSLIELSEYLYGGEDPNQNVHESDTLLHVAAQSERTNGAVVQKLIDAGANIDSTTSKGHTPLQFAVMSRNLDAVQALIRAGADPNIVNSFGRTALHYAVDSRLPSRRYIHPMHNMRILMTLFDSDRIDVNPVDPEGKTPLMWAVSLRHPEVVRLLLKRGANPSISDQRGQNCLHVVLAAQVTDFYIITELLLNGTSIYDADNLGRTPIDILLEAYRNDRIEYARIEFLLEIIAFKYQIRKDLKRKLGRFHAMYCFMDRACREVEWMNKQIIYDKMTLHDFAIECFRERRTVDAEAIAPVVSVLLSGRCFIYLQRILNLISREEFRTTLKSMFRSTIYYLDLMLIFSLPYRQNHEIFPSVQVLYCLQKHDNSE